MNKYNLSLFLVLLVFTSYGQGQLSGRVLDNRTYKPIIGARIKIIGTERKISTDSLGFFILLFNPSDSLTIECDGYLTLNSKAPDVNNFLISLSKLNEAEDTYTIVAEPTHFSGDFNAYVNKYLKYPKDVKKSVAKGKKIFVSLVIDSNGKIPYNEIKIMKGLSKSFDEEVIRVISESPNWVPGRQNMKSVRQRIVVPITFN